MDGRNEFGFCPKCGALTQNGVCQSCGHGKRTQNTQGYQNVEQPYAEAPRKKRKSLGVKIVIGICAALGVLLIVAIILGIIFFSGSAKEVQKWEPMPYEDSYKDDYFGYGDPYEDSYDDYGYYVPDADDEYYREVTDATEYGLSYGIIWQSVSMHPDDPDDMCTYDCTYPVLTGEDSSVYSSMNDKIEEMVCKYLKEYGDYKYGVTSYGYVTYMDEEKISVVVLHELDEEYTTVPLIDAITFEVKSGEEITHTEMQPVDDELVRFFRARDAQQNGTVEFVEEISDEELKGYLADEEQCVMFYTPVGLEIGFNYDGGWVTVTLKDDTL